MFLSQNLNAFLLSSKVEQDIADCQTLYSALQKNEIEINDQVLQNLMTIVHRSATDRRVALLTSHIISNLALNQTHANKLCELGAIATVFALLEKHSLDNRVVWKGSSALWNLFTVGGNGGDISSLIPEDAVLRLTSFLERDCGTRATHTVIGALGNLVLILPSSFLSHMTAEKLNFIGKLVRNYPEQKILAHFGALLANMASHSELAKICVASGQVQNLISIFRNNLVKTPEAFKHLCAGLHNLSDVEGFAQKLMICEGIEVLHQIIENLQGESAMFVDAIFDLAEIPRTATTSLQAAISCCDIHIITKLMCNPRTELNALDKEGKTACDRAMNEGFGAAVQFLCAAGAKWSLQFDEISSDMRKYLENGVQHRESSLKIMRAIITGHTILVNDMGCVVNSFIPGVDMLQMLQ